MGCGASATGSQSASRPQEPEEMKTLMKTAAQPAAAPDDLAAKQNQGFCASEESGVLEQLLVRGGDDRTTINETTGTNSYHCQARPISPGDVARSSCTCSNPTPQSFEAAMALLKERFSAAISKGDDAKLSSEVDAVHEEHRASLRDLLRLPDRTEICFCPSGSDAEYIPLVIARALAPGRRVVNIVTQHRETGSGTGAAAGGHFFSKLAPLSGGCCSRQKDSELAGLADGVVTEAVPARSRDGSPVDSAAAMADIQARAEQAGDYVISHRVVYGKTGLRDADAPGAQGDGTQSLTVVDACQLRSGVDDLSSWLASGCVVLVTGSKFYQGPPFSGCALLPAQLAARLREAEPLPAPLADRDFGLGAFFAKGELAPCLRGLMPGLPEKPNVGLALRWRASLANMGPLLTRFPRDDVRAVAVRAWESAVAAAVRELGRGVLEAWSTQGGIVAIRVRQAAGEDGWRGVAELRRVFGWCARDSRGLLPSSATRDERQLCARRCFLGQPVDVADDFAVLRIALGASDLERWLSEGAGNPTESEVLDEDRTCVRKLALVAAEYAAMASAEEASKL